MHKGYFSRLQVAAGSLYVLQLFTPILYQETSDTHLSAMGHLATAVVSQEATCAPKRLCTWPLNGSCKTLGYSDLLTPYPQAWRLLTGRKMLQVATTVLAIDALGTGAPDSETRLSPPFSSMSPRKSSACLNLTSYSVPSRLLPFVTKWIAASSLILCPCKFADTLKRMVCLVSRIRTDDCTRVSDAEAHIIKAREIVTCQRRFGSRNRQFDSGASADHSVFTHCCFFLPSRILGLGRRYRYWMT